MTGQRDLVIASLFARTGHDVGGARHHHQTEADRLRAENARLRTENTVLRESRAALIDHVHAHRSAA